MTTPRTSPLALASLLLVAIGPLRADDGAWQPYRSASRVAGRPDRDEILAGARRYAAVRPTDVVGPRLYERRPAATAATAEPRPVVHRTTASYFPNMGRGQYTNHTPRFAHCTPSRGYFIGER